MNRCRNALASHYNKKTDKIYLMKKVYNIINLKLSYKIPFTSNCIHAVLLSSSALGMQYRRKSMRSKVYIFLQMIGLIILGLVWSAK